MRLLNKGGLLVVLLVGVVYLFLKSSQPDMIWKELSDTDRQEVTTLLAETKPEEMYFPTTMPEEMNLDHAEARTENDTVTVECYFQKFISGRNKRHDFSPPKIETESLWFLQSNDPAYITKQSGMEEGQTLQEGTYQFQKSQLGNTLCWKQGNLTCILRGEMQEQDMKKIAESMQPV